MIILTIQSITIYFIQQTTKIIMQPYIAMCKCQNHTQHQYITIDQIIYCQICLRKTISQQSLQNITTQNLQHQSLIHSILKLQSIHLFKQIPQINKSQSQQSQLLQIQLKTLQKQYQLLHSKKNHLKKLILKHDQQQKIYWNNLNQLELKVTKLQQKQNSVKYDLIKHQQQLQTLKQLNILSQVFKITFQNQVASINGMPIGKKKKFFKIDWQQTNSALGHLFLMFTFVIIKYQYTCLRFQQFDCVGAISKVKINKKYYQIAYTQQTQKQFGIVLDQLLIQLELLRAHIQIVAPRDLIYSQPLSPNNASFVSNNNSKSQNSTYFDYPNKISINDMTINSEYVNPTRIKSFKWDKWTVAMKYLLTNFQAIGCYISLSDMYI